MGCNQGPDGADFASGLIDPIDDPIPVATHLSIDDAIAVKESDGIWRSRFTVGVSGINYDDPVSVNYATSNGSGIAGTNYVSASGTVTIPAGFAETPIVIQWIAPTGATGTKTLNVTLSVPVNADIWDATGIGTIDYGQPEPPPPDPIDHTKDARYTRWPTPSCTNNGGNKTCPVYDQFNGWNHAMDTACTAFAAAAAMSALYWIATGTNVAFDARDIYDGAFCPSQSCECDSSGGGCTGKNPQTALNYVRDTGARPYGGGTRRKFTPHSLLPATKADLISSFKSLIVNKGVVYFSSPFYSSPNHGWNRCLSCNGKKLRTVLWLDNQSNTCGWPANDLVRHGGHAWIIVGWDNNVGGGSFIIQSSHGSDWGDNGRCYLRWSEMGLSGSWDYWSVTYVG